MPLVKVPITSVQLCEIFNKHYLPMFQRGDLNITVIRSGTPDTTANQPAGTKSEIWELHTRQGKYIGKVHAYVKRDGTLSASGLPDPKELIHGNKRYVLSKTKT